jgi:hypothetical protein
MDLIDTIVTEFRGEFPNIPIRKEVNVEELTKGDDDPFFITLKISEVGATSGNGLVHDETLGETLSKQINEQAAHGIAGHLKDEDRSTAFPMPAVYWLGAARLNGATWAKGYIPRTAEKVREHFRIQKVTGGKAATSIYGPGTRETLDKQKKTWRLADFKLEQLDLAPFERAALPLEGVFVVTAQMDAQSQKDEENMEKSQIIAELTAEDVKTLPAVVREAIIKQYQEQEGQQEQVKELQSAVEAGKARISELEQQLAKVQVAEFSIALDKLVAETIKIDAKSEDGKKRVASLQSLVRRYVVAELAGKTDLDAAQAAIKEYTASDEYKTLAGAVVAELAGPAALIAQAGKSGEIDMSPEAQAKARSDFGF